MKTLTLEVRPLKGALVEVASAVTSRWAMRAARISFATPELLWQVLTAKRWEILRAMAGAGPLGIREIARRVERDVKAVHADVHALLKAGILSKTPEGSMSFQYDAVHVDFVSLLARKTGKVATIEEMNEAAARGWAGKGARGKSAPPRK